jgi:hypothetical protein
LVEFGDVVADDSAELQNLGSPAGNQWDYLALVYYPSVAEFIDMMTSADYENRCDPHRRNGCAEHVIICTQEAYSKFKVGWWKELTVLEIADFRELAGDPKSSTSSRARANGSAMRTPPRLLM